MLDLEAGLLSALVLAGHMLLVATLAVRILFRHLPVGTTLASHGESITGFAALQGHELELLPGWDSFVDALVADIEAARRTCHLEFYICDSAGRVGEIYTALARAAARGVICRVLVDDVGSGPFLKSREASGLRKVGVKVVRSLPVGLFRMLFVRMDLRNHRKIIVIDGEIGYTGSMNLVDPVYFKTHAGVGRWVDAMVRLRGPAVEVLNGAFLEDWELETDEGMSILETADIHSVPEQGAAVVQVVPSGPGLNRASTRCWRAMRAPRVSRSCSRPACASHATSRTCCTPRRSPWTGGSPCSAP